MKSMVEQANESAKALSEAMDDMLTLAEIKKLVLDHSAKIKNLDKRLKQHDRSFKNIEEEYPLLPPEADDLSREVQRKGVEVMGGKRSAAYKDTALRRNVYRDIYTEIKRQYGLIDDLGRQKSYKKLKRKYLNGAMAVVAEYELPITLQNEVDALNDLEDID